MRAVDADRLIAEVEKLRLHGYGSYVYGRNDTIDMVAKLIIAAPTADPDADREERIRKFREMTNTAALNCDAIEIGLVEPQQKTGKWIEEQDYMGFFVCSECGYTVARGSSYCPKCGSLMSRE